MFDLDLGYVHGGRPMLGRCAATGRGILLLDSRRLSRLTLPGAALRLRRHFGSDA